MDTVDQIAEMFRKGADAQPGDGRITSIGRWGRQPTFQAKIGTGPSAVVIVRRTRRFKVGQHIQFADIHDLSGMCVGCTPKWRGGHIYKIENDRLFIELM